MEKEIKQSRTVTDEVKQTAWRSASNIALVKYWGKHSEQLPMNPSISITLENAHTETSLSWSSKTENREFAVEFRFEGEENPLFGKKIEKYIQRIAQDYPILKEFDYSIESSNSFPHSTGIASSASSMSALAMNLYSMLLMNGAIPNADVKLASNMSRLGSGSACRSVYPGFSLWGSTPIVQGSSDKYAIDVNENIHPDFQKIHDSILIVDSAKKKVSSTQGHALMTNHSFRESRILQSHDNLRSLLDALKIGDWEKFTEVVELEALTLHALMMSSVPSYILLHPNTLRVIEKIRDFRDTHSTPMAFTLDAGPNVHLLYPDSHADKIKPFIKAELESLCEDGRILHDIAGKGPQKLS